MKFSATNANNVKKPLNNTISISIQIGAYQEYQKNPNEKITRPIINRQFTGSLYGLMYNHIR